MMKTPPYSMATAYSDGVKFSEAAAFLKQWLVVQAYDSGEYRAAVIERSYREVFGRTPSATEQALWDARIKAEKIWYVTLVREQRKSLLAPGGTAEKAQMIKRAYTAGFGRAATADESKYWMARPDHYRLVREANRTWLYSPAGAKELVDSIGRAYTWKTGKKATDAQVKASLTAFSGYPTKPIFEDMLNIF